MRKLIILILVGILTSFIASSQNIVKTDGNPPCVGQSLNFTYQGSCSSVAWSRSGVQTSSFVVSSDGKSVAVVPSSNGTLSITATPNGPGCTGSSAGGISISISAAQNTPLVNVVGDGSNVYCIGSSVKYNAISSFAWGGANYVWFKNGVSQQAGTVSSYTSTTFATGDQIKVTMSNFDYLQCPTNQLPVTSNTITATIGTNVPAVTITANDNVCAGVPVTFTANSTTGGTYATYVWFKNDVQQQSSNSNAYTSTTLVTGDQVYVMMTPDGTKCPTNFTPVKSNTITTTVKSTGSIIGNFKQQTSNGVVSTTLPFPPICARPYAANYSVSPVLSNNVTGSYTIVWQKNGFDVSDNTSGSNSIYSPSVTLVTYDIIKCTITEKSGACLTNGNNVLVLTTNVQANAPVSPSANINFNPTSVCYGNNSGVNFSVSSPNSINSYTWNMGGSSSSTSTFSPSIYNGGNGTLNLGFTGCVTQSTMAIAIPVVPQEPAQFPTNSISLSTFNSQNPCDLTFTSSSTYQGTNPTYQWTLNNGPVLGTNQSYSSSFASGTHTIRNTMVSNYFCINPLGSATVQASSTFTINPVNSSLSITNTTPLTNCQGAAMSFVASVATPSSSFSPVYQWKVDGVNAGTNYNQFSSTTLSPGAHQISCTVSYNSPCFVPVTSNTLNIYIEGSYIISNSNSSSNNNYISLPSANAQLTWILNSYTNAVPCQVTLEAYPPILYSLGYLPNVGAPLSYNIGNFTPANQPQSATPANLGITQDLTDKNYYWRIKIMEIATPTNVYYSDFQQFTLVGSQQPGSSPAIPSTIAVDAINYNYEVAYLDGGKTSESIVYTDGLGNTRQVQTKLNTESKYMCVETAYSEEGGGTVQTLPAPTDQTQFAYAKSFFDISNAGVLRDFTTSDFDKEQADGSLINPTQLASTAKVAAYYSSSNTDPYVDDAEGYPYSYKVWMKNPLGKVQLTSGAGGTFRYKQNGTGKNTKYTFAAVASEDLKRVFGKTEADKLTSVSAITSIDPNGVSNFTYQDKEGKVLATAINACDVTNMDKPGNEDDAAFPITYNILENDPIDFGSLEKTTSKSFNISCATDITLNYAVALKTMPTQGTQTCLTCQYDLEVRIIENATGVPVHTKTISLPEANSVPTCTTATAYAYDPIPFRIDRPGSYTVYRTIKPKFDPLAGKTVIEQEFDRFSEDIKTNANYSYTAYQALTNPDVKEEWFLMRKLRTMKYSQPQSEANWNEYLACKTNPTGPGCTNWMQDVWYVDDVSILPSKLNMPGGLFPGLQLSGVYKDITCTTQTLNTLAYGINFADPSAAVTLSNYQPSGISIPMLPDISQFRKGAYDGGSLCINDADIALTGFINVPQDGVYTFYGFFDDYITIQMDGVSVFTPVNGTSYFYYTTTPSFAKLQNPLVLFTATLTAGLHPITVQFSDYTPPYYLTLFWKKPGDATYSLIGNESFFYGTPLYTMAKLEGKINKTGDESYNIEGVQNPVNSNLTTDFLTAYNRQNYKNLQPTNITSIQNYDIKDVAGNSQISNTNAAKYIKTLMEDNSLNASSKQQFYLLKVKYNTGGCDQEAYVKKAPDPNSASCTSFCAEQKVSLEQDLKFKLADCVNNYGLVDPYFLVDPMCPVGTTCTTKNNYNLQALMASYSTNPSLFKTNWAATFDNMQLRDINLPIELHGAIYLEKWIASTERLNNYNSGNCLNDCANALAPTGVCSIINPIYTSCVLDNISRIGVGFDYLSNLKYPGSSKAFMEAGGVFPFVIDNNQTQRTDKIQISTNDRQQLGEPLFNFIMKYFDSANPDIKTQSFWSPGTLASSTTAFPYSYGGTGGCNVNPILDISNFTPGLVMVLTDANLSCQDEYKRSYDTQTTGDSYIIAQHQNECIAAATSANLPTTNCVITGTQIRGDIIRTALNAAYPNPDDLQAKFVQIQQKDAGAYWLWLMGNSNATYGPPNVLSIAALKKYMMNYLDTEKMQADCQNRNVQAYNDWKKSEVTKYKTQVVQNFINSCFGAMNESLTITYSNAKYHFTLYKYDGAGRLIQTVPPEGVDYVRPADPVNKVPAHRLATTYSYDSFGELVSSSTPDGGVSSFVYDNLGRVRFSQSSEQAARTPTACSYTNYDAAGRIVESGEVVETLANVKLQIESPTFPDNTKTKNDKVLYYYTTLKAGLPSNFTQTYCDGRISYTENNNVATYYSYDVHGRVNALLHEFKALGTTEKYKKIDYEYQPVSGIVNKVIFQKGVTNEEFAHKYSYDDDNRLIKVEVSKNATAATPTWSGIADYTYYTHGPLKSLSLGDHVQRINYTYNLQGWLKAINHPRSEYDPGQDGLTGTSGSLWAKDVFAMILNYYKGDYVRSANIPGTTSTDISLNQTQMATYMPVTDETGTASVNKGVGLYNGNISGIVNYTGFDQTHSMGFVNPVLSQRYRYDYLNRLQGSFAETKPNLTGQVWASNTTGASIYQELLTYDANGNIMTLNRSGASSAYFDNLSYNYNLTNGFKTNNKLRYFDEASTMPNQGSYDLSQQVVNAYDYDQKGRLTQDLSESIGVGGIAWTSFDKIKSITRSSTGKSNLDFTYDPMGRRASKKVKDPANSATELFTEYYVYDATGNTIATYKKPSAQALALQEYYMYGSSRLGSYDGTTASIEATKLSFEITDHLGNVRAVVSGDPIRDGSNSSNYMAYDGFSSTTQNLAGSNGGAGWSTNLWTADATPPNSYEVATSNPFAYTNLTPTAGHAESVGGNALIGRAINAVTDGPLKVSHSFSFTANSTPKTVTWEHDLTDRNGMVSNAKYATALSFLIRKNTNTDIDEASVSLTSDATPNTRSNITLAVGYFGAPSITAGQKYWSLKLNNTVYQSTVPVVVGTGASASCFVVVDIAPGKVNVYFNPTFDAQGIISSAVSVSAVPAATLLYKNVVYYGGATAGHSSVDEIKIGESIPNVINFSNPATQYQKLLLHEPFDYTSGNLVGLAGGGSGTTANWTGAWAKTNWVSPVMSGTSLPYGDLQLSGGNVTTTGYASAVGRQVDLTATTGPFASVLNATGLVGKPATTVWGAVLLQVNTDGVEENSVSFGTGATPAATGSNAVAMGYFGLASQDAQGNRFWSLKVGSTVYKTTIPIVKNIPTLLVSKTDFVANASAVKLFVNPTLFLEPTVADASATTALDISFKNVVYQGNNGAMDELLLGLSYNAVWGVRGKRAKILSLTDYYPFGSDMPGRKFVADSYKYGFNGKEKDAETGDQDYGFRIYKPSIGRFLSVDPLTSKYAYYSPYHFAGNDPIKFIDLDGLEEYDPSNNNEFFTARLVLTTWFDLKHSVQRLLLNGFVPTDNPNLKWNATYKEVDGEKIFETEIKQVPKESILKETVNYTLDVINTLSMMKIDPSDVLAAKSGSKTQVTETARKFIGSNGTITASTTLFKQKGSKARIDVENSGTRNGQIHYQDENNVKYMYHIEKDKFFGENPKTGEFNIDAPRKVNDLLKNKHIRTAINKGKQYLGIK